MTDHTAEDLPAPWPDVLDALNSITGANREVFALVEQIHERHGRDIDRLYDECAKLRNDVTALGRTLASRTDHLA